MLGVDINEWEPTEEQEVTTEDAEGVLGEETEEENDDEEIETTNEEGGDEDNDHINAHYRNKQKHKDISKHCPNRSIDFL